MNKSMVPTRRLYAVSFTLYAVGTLNLKKLIPIIIGIRPAKTGLPKRSRAGF
jgi:hypothetical protein